MEVLIMICNYGCGKPGKHQFKNGKWCCSKNISSCSAVKEKMSKKKIGKIPWNKGKIGVQKNPFKGVTGRYSQESLDKMRKSSIMSEEQKMYLKIYNRRPIEKWIEKYPTFSMIEEMRYNPNKPGEKEIQVHCKNHNCSNSKEQGGWFTPKNYDQFVARIWSIENDDGKDGHYYYCSKKCKDECPLYGKHVTELIREDKIRAGHIEDSWYTSQEYQEWRQQVFKLDNNRCVYCEQLAIISHHILPQKTHPELSLDPENGISVCEKCHYKYGHKGECSTGNLSKLVCERIIRIKEK